MGTEPLSLFLSRISRPFSAVSGNPGDGSWLDGVGLRPWGLLSEFNSPSRVPQGPAQGLPCFLGLCSSGIAVGPPCLTFAPSHADSLLSSSFSRVRVRYQKRQKLQFETKLGMNSPF